MEAQPNNIKIIWITVTALLVLGAGYLLFNRFSVSREAAESPTTRGNQDEMIVVVENTPAVGGVIRAPAGFPQGIPIEAGAILESATTHYPEQNARQLSLSYRSLRTVAQKYGEYRDYMQRAGYEITEGPANSPVRTIFGVGADANLSVAISRTEGATLVQLSYLLKSI